MHTRRTIHRSEKSGAHRIREHVAGLKLAGLKTHAEIEDIVLEGKQLVQLSCEGLELAVKVDLVVDRIREAAEPGADILVGAGPQHMQLVRIAKVAELDAGAVEGLLCNLGAVQLTAVDRGCQEIDKRFRSRLLAKEVDRGFAGKAVAVPGQIERNVVERGLDQRGPPAGFIARQVIAGMHC